MGKRPFVLLFAILAFRLWGCDHPKDKWVLEGYDDEKGYTFSLNYVEYIGHCVSWSQLSPEPVLPYGSTLGDVGGHAIWATNIISATMSPAPREFLCTPIDKYVDDEPPVVLDDSHQFLIFLPDSAHAKTLDLTKGNAYVFEIAKIK
jgi:hypothetical protein